MHPIIFMTWRQGACHPGHHSKIPNRAKSPENLDRQSHSAVGSRLTRVKSAFAHTRMQMKCVIYLTARANISRVNRVYISGKRIEMISGAMNYNSENADIIISRSLNVISRYKCIHVDKIFNSNGNFYRMEFSIAKIR